MQLFLNMGLWEHCPGILVKFNVKSAYFGRLKITLSVSYPRMYRTSACIIQFFYWFYL